MARPKKNSGFAKHLFQQITPEDIVEQYTLPNGATFTKLRPGTARGIDGETWVRMKYPLTGSRKNSE